jgi:peroxiredoxin
MHVCSLRVGLSFLCSLLLTSTPLAAQVRVSFSEPPNRDLQVAPLTDQRIDDLLTTLDAAMALPDALDEPAWDPELNLWKFFRWLQSGTMTAAQETRIVEHLRKLAGRHPERAGLLERHAAAVRRLTVGKMAPEIEGTDLEGVNFRLSDYRGKVVLLTFSGDWCAICRTEYPYHRLLSELYEDFPFAILSVNSDTTAEKGRHAKMNRGLAYRSWWEKKSDSSRPGPIAAAYNLYGWPTTYILDESGVIRFVDLRQEDAMKAVRQLLSELERRALQTEAASR